VHNAQKYPSYFQGRTIICIQGGPSGLIANNFEHLGRAIGSAPEGKTVRFLDLASRSTN